MIELAEVGEFLLRFILLNDFYVILGYLAKVKVKIYLKHMQL